MKFLKSSIAVLFISVVFVACQKDKEITNDDQSNQDPPVAEMQPVEGKWMGLRYGINKSMPFEFGFNIKANGILDVLDTKKDVTGSGTWKLENNIFKAVFTTSSGEKYSLKSDVYVSADKISGTWGYDNNEDDGGFWKMNKQD